jgi:hypothetical protein
VCSFNPVYGQGMTTAALGAATLGACLKAHGVAAVGPAFQRALYETIRPAWTMAIGEDFRSPKTVGPPLGPAARAMQWYLGQLLAQMGDPVLRRAFVEVMHMTRMPSSLMHPSLAARVLAGRIRQEAHGRRARAH